MKLWNQYLIPESIEDAMDILRSHKDRTRLIAGGTDLLLDMQQGRHPPVDTLVDISAIPELRRIDMVDGEIQLGSGTTHRMILESAILKENASCLVQACRGIGGSQVRNVATIGGNVAHALPAGDGSIALLALDSKAKIINQEGERWESMENLFKGPGEPTFDPCQELLAAFRFPRRGAHERSAFHRVMRPQGVAIAILNMAIWLRSEDGRKADAIRIAVGPAGPIPFRARQTEEYLTGRQIDEAAIARATDSLREEARLRTSKYRATQKYRRHLLGYLLRMLLDLE